MNAYSWIDDELQRLSARGLRRTRRVRQSPQAAAIRLDDRALLNFGSNDYLGLAAELAQCQQVEGRGWGSGASPMITGRSEEHRQLEYDLAAFEQAEAALVFTSGYAANVGTITALADRQTTIFSDEKNHASIIDGCRLSGGRIVIYPHADAAALRELLVAAQENSPQRSGRRLIVSDSVFSMDGDIAPLPQLAQLAAEFNAMLLVDEAHATGVFGAAGRGVVESLGLEHSIPVRVGTMSKALGTIGGFTVGPRPVIEWIAHAARSYFFSTAIPDAQAAAARAALRLVQDQPERRQKLLSRAAALRREFLALGWNIGGSQSQIIPVILGDSARTMSCFEQLLQRGIFVPGIRPPSVPEGQSLLRISLSYLHTEEHLQQLMTALGDVLADH